MEFATISEYEILNMANRRSHFGVNARVESY